MLQRSKFTKPALGLCLLLFCLASMGCRGPQLASGQLSSDQRQWSKQLGEWHPGWNEPYVAPVRYQRSQKTAGEEFSPADEGLPMPQVAEGEGTDGPVDEAILIPIEEKEASGAAIRQYTVRKGDTLSGIAVRFYGKANEWKRIWEANRQVLESPDKLYPGLILDIPAAD